jgi:hypothetical protein
MGRRECAFPFVRGDRELIVVSYQLEPVGSVADLSNFPTFFGYRHRKCDRWNNGDRIREADHNC